MRPLFPKRNEGAQTINNHCNFISVESNKVEEIFVVSGGIGRVESSQSGGEF
jgi:hypothetical protein